MDAIELETYRHLFASIAEEMGATLMRSSFSPNIKERRDFSCAIFDVDGVMVAQAAHIPVHLGSTPLSVRAAIDRVEMGPGDHAILNDPYAGGTHLPDITFVSPVYDDDSGELIFYVANRAHHADVGGMTAGSLPLSSSIDDEGIRIEPRAWGPEIEEQILSASRTPDERRGDLRAQIAANRRGAERLAELARRHAGRRLAEAASALQDYSERFVRSLIDEMPDGSWSFEDRLDGDGHGHRDLAIRCELTVRGDEAILDFGGTCEQVRGPVNVPRAVTLSAVLYAFRCLAPPELPTNGGAMRPLELRTEPGTLVDARAPAAVAIGNVETSQRITDVVFGALSRALPGRIPAASCGSMNNITIGGRDARRSGGDARPYAYYETLAGGSGASARADGADAVHTHMTNTLNTPVEALEHAYPFRVERYRVRRDSGGAGRHRGGDGVVRAYAFDGPATVGLMTERRRHRPYGLEGGAPGAAGRNVLVRDGEEIELDAKVSVEVRTGDRIVVETPGGGGYGAGEKSDADDGLGADHDAGAQR